MPATAETPKTTPEATPAPKPEAVVAKTPEELKAEEAKSLLNKDGKKPEAKAEAAPDKYTEFKVPEGFKLDETTTKEAGDLFKSLNLSQDSGQKLIDYYTAKTKEAAEAPYKLYTKMREDWQTAVKADPEIGGKLGQVKITISRALDVLGDAKLATEFREAMDLTGAGDNPAFIRALYKLAQRVTEGKDVTPGGPAAVKAPGSAPPSAAKAMYPNLP